MKNWKIGLTVSIATSLLLVACGGEDSVKSAPAAKASGTTVTSAAPLNIIRVSSNGASGRVAGAADAHNRVRSKHNLPPLAWSDSLASYAQEWANQLADAKGCQMEHRPNGGQFKQLHGENLYWASPKIWSDGRREAQDISINDVVGSWASEEKDYNYSNNSCAPGKQCGHYTQIVWKSTTAVGCAVKQCGDSAQLWVCNYSPAGNYVGEKPY